MKVSFSKEKRMDMAESFMKMVPITLACGKITNGMARENMQKTIIKYRRVNGKMEKYCNLEQLQNWNIYLNAAYPDI